MNQTKPEETFARLGVMGLGYIGLPTAAMFASSGVEVVGVDIHRHVVDTINSGKAHVVEPDLDAIVARVTGTRRLRAALTPAPADAFIIAVGTPCREGHQPDVSYIQAAAAKVGEVLAPGNLIVLESTSPVGTTEQMAAWLAQQRPDLTFPQHAGDDADIQIAYCPERVLPGKILTELVHNDRIIGGLSRRCARRAASLYRAFVKAECILTNARTAELAKLSENSFRDVNIAFANELSLICDRLDIDVWELISLANRHPRVKILQPGPGVGGHCIAVDPWFIVHSAPEQAKLIRAAREVNDSKPEHVIQKVLDAAAGHDTPVVACLGLAYKANTDDLRESPAVHIARELAGRLPGGVLVVEPHVEIIEHEFRGLPVKLVELSTALAQADVIVLLVDHDVFKEITMGQLSGKDLIDTRGLWRSSTTTRPACRLAA